MDTPDLTPDPDHVSPPPEDPAAPAAGLQAPDPTVDLPAAAAPRCLNHPGLEAAYLCDGCQATVCATCAFAFPGERHLCPACAEMAVNRVSGSRRRARHWSLALGLWALVSFLAFLGVAAVSPETDASYMLLGLFFMLFVVLPVAVGLVLAILAVRSPHGAVPVAVAALTLNGVVAALSFLLIIVGIFMPE